MKIINKKRGQEEMVGFAMIIIIVAVILLVFLSLSLNKNSGKELIESYEVESFIGSTLQHTTGCRDNLEFISVQKLIFDCIQDPDDECLDGGRVCDVLEKNLNEILEGSWSVKNSPTKGYFLNISSNDESLVSISAGNSTNNYQAGTQELAKSGNLVRIEFFAYA